MSQGGRGWQLAVGSWQLRGPPRTDEGRSGGSIFHSFGLPICSPSAEAHVPSFGPSARQVLGCSQPDCSWRGPARDHTEAGRRGGPRGENLVVEPNESGARLRWFWLTPFGSRLTRREQGSSAALHLEPPKNSRSSPPSHHWSHFSWEHARRSWLLASFWLRSDAHVLLYAAVAVAATATWSSPKPRLKPGLASRRLLDQTNHQPPPRLPVKRETDSTLQRASSPRRFARR